MFVYECVQTGLVSADAWTKLILGYSDIAEHFSKGYLWFTLPVMCTVLSATVQTYFAWRLWMLSMSRVIPAIISLLALAQMGAGFTAAADMKMHWPIPRYWEADLYNTSICVWLAGSALTDVIIAVSMTLTLSKAKTHYSRSSDCLVNRLVKIIVETGTLTASVAVVTLVLFSALPVSTIARSWLKERKLSIISSHNNSRRPVARSSPSQDSTMEILRTVPSLSLYSRKLTQMAILQVNSRRQSYNSMGKLNRIEQAAYQMISDN